MTALGLLQLHLEERLWNFTLHNLGFVIILLGLYCWYLAWRVFEAPSTSPVEAELILKNPVLGGIVGLLLLGIGYNFVNPSKSQYPRDIERHGYPRNIPSNVRYQGLDKRRWTMRELQKHRRPAF